MASSGKSRKGGGKLKLSIGSANTPPTSAKKKKPNTPSVTDTEEQIEVTLPHTAAPTAPEVIERIPVFKDPNFVHSTKGAAGTKRTRGWKNLKQVSSSEKSLAWRPDAVTYSSIEGPPSFRPAKKYSDLSGLAAKYKDPQTKLRYSTSKEFSQVGSFLLDREEMEDGEQMIEATKFLLPAENMETTNLQTVDPETHARLEALLEAAGIGKLSTADGKVLTDPEVLRKLTSSVSCALDEAAAALHRMRAEQQGQLGNEDSSRSLAEACSDGDVGTVKKILQEGGSVNETTEEGESLLSLACSAGYYELAQVLLAMKANVEDRGIKGDCTPLMEAASGGYIDIVRLLIAHVADVNAQSSAGNTPLHYAACGGYEDVVLVLIEAEASVEVHNENGHTPLMEAASAGHVGVAKILLEAGAGINTHSNEFKESALTLACYKGHLEMVRFLLGAGADQEHKTDEMHTALMEASMDGHVEVARLLLDSGAQVNMPADSFESPLTLAACGGHVELANLLIERGANLEEVNDEGYTPLMEAAREGHEEMVALLLAHGADINAQTEETQETALTLACCGGFLDVADFLIKACADIELGCSTPLMEAAQEGHLELVRYLLKAVANVHAQTGTGDTALTYACENGHTDVAEVLLEAGAELEHESEGGRTPLMKAARAGHLCTVQFLISKGANVNRQTSTNDHTVLSLACAGGHIEVVELLLAHGADPAHRLKDGSTMIIEAAKGGYTAVVNLLLEYPSRVLLSTPELSQTEPHLTEHRVPVHGLGNIVPPNDPDSCSTSSSNYAVNPSGQKTTIDFCLSPRHSDQMRLGAAKWKKAGDVVGKPAADTGGVSPDYCSLSNENIDMKTGEKVEALINSVMTKELVSAGFTREEQILRKQQILEELQKVERELEEKAEAQFLLSAHHQLDQQQYNPKRQTALLEVQAKLKWDQLPENLAHIMDTSFDGSKLNSVDSSHLHELFANEQLNERQQQQQSSIPSLDNNYVEQSLNQPLAEGNVLVNSREFLNKLTEQQKKSSNFKLIRGKGSCTGPNTDSSGCGSPPQDAQTIRQPLELQQLQLQQLHLLPQQQETLFQFLSQPALQQQQQVQQQLLPGVQQQYLSQSPLLQQQHLLQQQLLNQSAVAAVPPKQRHVANSHPTLGLETITPPPSMPLTPTPSPASPHSISPLHPPIDLDAQTESNHDTALTLACAGGHAELVKLLLSKGAEIEHRDKKGFTPLILASTAGHVEVVEILLEHGAEIEAQSERTKDTPLSLACSGGRYEVVELLLSRGANKEHRNVSDYTPLSLAASGGYVNIIKLLLSHGAEINSRTGSKLGISPLMLAAMNGHTAAVKLLLDMGSDINAQIETNRNTALTLACFQGRHEVVSLLVDRKANTEHRAKTGLTPLMEAASGGYVEVGKVLLDKGADVNAAPVPSSRDTALTIAADKGHYRFVELLLSRQAAVDVKNKKGNSPLWLACNGGHLDVVQLLINAGADIDSEDNRKVSCLVAAFRKGHLKVVKWMVKHVMQFPLDNELSRYIATVGDKDIQKKCQQCMETIVSAKDRQAAEANKNATILLEELDKERQWEENKRAAAAKRRERKKKKKKEKLEKEKELNKNSSPEPEGSGSSINQEEVKIATISPFEPPAATITTTISKQRYGSIVSCLLPVTTAIGTTLTNSIMTEAKNMKNRCRSMICQERRAMQQPSIVSQNGEDSKRNRRLRNKIKDRPPDCTLIVSCSVTSVTTVTVSPTVNCCAAGFGLKRKKMREFSIIPITKTAIGDLDDFGTIPDSLKISDREIEKLTKSVDKNKIIDVYGNYTSHAEKNNSSNNNGSSNILTLKTSTIITSPKRGQKKEEGWKEVVRKSKKITVPANAISRVIGRAGSNINAIREVSGAHIEVEKQKGSGDRVVTIKGSADATRQAHALINALVSDPDKELVEILPKNKNNGSTEWASLSVSADSASSGQVSNSGVSGASEPVPVNVVRSPRPKAQNAQSSGSASSASVNAQRSVLCGQPQAWGSAQPHPVLISPQHNAKQISSSQQQTATASRPPPVGEPKVARQLFPVDKRTTVSLLVTSTNATVTYSVASSGMKMVTSTASPKTDTRPSVITCSQLAKPVSSNYKLLQRSSPGTSKHDLLQIGNSLTTSHSHSQCAEPPPPPGEYSPFNNLFSNVAEQVLGKKEDPIERMNFASVAAAGVTTPPGPMGLNSLPPMPSEPKFDPALQAKAPGYKPNGQRTSSPQQNHDIDVKTAVFKGNFGLSGSDVEIAKAHGYHTNITTPTLSPRSNPSTPGLSPRGRSNASLEVCQHQMLSSQKEEYSMPNQPMTLPKIESTLNPHAPDFTARLKAAHSSQHLPPNFLGRSSSNLSSSSIPASIYPQAAFMNHANFNNIPPPPPPPQPGYHPISHTELAQNYNLLSQLSNQAQATGILPSAQQVPRSYSPLPPQVVRPNSAPSVGMLSKENTSAVPLNSQGTGSLMPSSNTPPPPLEQLKPVVDERKLLRPIGGERLYKKPTVGSIPDGGAGDYNNIMMWGLSSAAMSSPVMTSSAVSTGIMTTTITGPPESRVPSLETVRGSVLDGKRAEQQAGQSFSNHPILMPLFTNGIPSHYPVLNPSFVNRDGVPNMWNPQMKPPVTDVTDKMQTWTSWSQSANM